MLPNLKKLYNKQGTHGILTWIYDKKRFFIVKVILKTLFYFFPYEFLLKQTADFNSNIKKMGYSKATQSYLKSLNISVKKKRINELSGPCLIFGNHPTGLDPYLIAASLDRNDVYIVADVYQRNKGKQIGKHIIPIVYTKTRENLSQRGFFNSVGFYMMRFLTGYENLQTVKKQNRQTIQAAANLLRNGHCVIIFPDGGSNNPQFWYNGIGEIIKQCDNVNIKLYATHIFGVTTTTLFRHFFLNKKKLLHDNPIEIEISQALTLDSLQINTSDGSKHITERLRSEFSTNRLWHPNYAYTQS